MPRVSKKVLALDRIRQGGWKRIGRAEWESLRADFSEAMLRMAAAELGIPIDQPYAGIGTKTLDELDSSLVAMAEVYASEPDLRPACRDIVIASKDRTRFAALNPKTNPDTRKTKIEMVERMLVWLGDPAMFAAWAGLRNRAGYWISNEFT